MSDLESVKEGDTVLEWHHEQRGFTGGKSFLLPTKVERTTKTLIITKSEKYRRSGSVYKADTPYWRKFGIEQYSEARDQSKVRNEYVDGMRMVDEIRNAIEFIHAKSVKVDFDSPTLKDFHDKVIALKNYIKTQER